MNHEYSKQLQDYIEKVKSLSKIEPSNVEKVINSQVAILLGDLAVKSESETFVGKIKLKKGNQVNVEISETIKEIVQGKINPLHLLLEILNG